jgi:hypothetical protein
MLCLQYYCAEQLFSPLISVSISVANAPTSSTSESMSVSKITRGWAQINVGRSSSKSVIKWLIEAFISLLL